MKVTAIYRTHSEHARVVEEFMHEFKRVHGRSVAVADLDTREGAAIATLYDVMQYPALLAVSDDGRMLQMWVGEPLPLMNEVAAYVD